MAACACHPSTEEAPDYLESGLRFGHSPEEGFKADGIMKAGARLTFLAL